MQAPLGFWDPLGLSSDGNLYSFKRRRSVELKHGRICMLALWQSVNGNNPNGE